MSEELLRVENIEFSPNGNKIINGINLTVNKGEVVSISGKSGCGKSTLLKMMAGIILPTKGKLYIEGKRYSHMSESEILSFRKKSAFIFQDSALWANQTIQQNLELPLKVHFPKMSKEEIAFSVQGVCAMVSYDKDLKLRPSDLSLGEQKKVAFARAMICGPEILFLDECTDSLDNAGAELIINLVKNCIALGNTVIFCSHDRDFVSEFNAIEYHIEKGLLADEV